MDLLKSALAERQAKAQKVVAETGQKWIRRSEIESKRIEDYMEDKRKEEEKWKADDEDRMQKLDAHLAKSKAKEPAKQLKAIPAHILNEAMLDDDDAEPPISISEIMDRLREMAQPITVFGETDMQRYKRMRAQETEAHEGRKNPDILMLEMVHQNSRLQIQQENDDNAKQPGDQSDDDDDDDEGKEKKEKKKEEKKQEEAESSSDEEDSEGTVGTDTSESSGLASGTAPGSEDAAMQVDGGEAVEETPEEKKKREKAQAKAEMDALPDVDVDLKLMDKCDFIRSWVRKAVKAWEAELAAKPDEDKKKPAMKTEVAQHRQVRRDVRPLQKRLRIYVIDPWLLDKIYHIVKNAAEREYRNAAEAYLDLSIGKAAWPVGIGCGGSMLMEDAIGLHDRFNRNNQVKDIAWAMNDEPTRKFVQALKRLMNVCQRAFPPDDPSKMC